MPNHAFIRKCVPPFRPFSCKSKSFQFGWFRTKTRFKNEAKGNSEMAYSNGHQLTDAGSAESKTY